MARKDRTPTKRTPLRLTSTKGTVEFLDEGFILDKETIKKLKTKMKPFTQFCCECGAEIPRGYGYTLGLSVKCLSCGKINRRGIIKQIEKGCGEEMEIENYFNIEGNIKTVKCGEEDYLCDCCQNLIQRLNKIIGDEE